jgi:hypothetical protein
MRPINTGDPIVLQEPEQVFAKLKTLLRKVDARSVGETWRSIGSLIDVSSPQECKIAADGDLL